MSILEIKGLTKKYGSKTAVSELSLTVDEGDIFGFIGHNGAGKTTTIRSVVGISDFDSGDILINGISIKSDPISCKRIISYIPDNPDLYEYLTGAQYLSFISDIFGISSGERKKRIGDYADAFGMTPALGDLISSYSHGMKQKTAVIGALIHEPKLMILDEPFVGLDPEAIVIMKGVMHDMVSHGAAVFFSTHVLDVAERLCGKIAIIKNGALVTSGKTDVLTGGKPLEEVFMEVVRGSEEKS